MVTVSPCKKNCGVSKTTFYTGISYKFDMNILLLEPLSADADIHQTDIMQSSKNLYLLAELVKQVSNVLFSCNRIKVKILVS